MIKFISNADNSPRATLAGSGVRQHQVTLSWQSASSGIAGYNIYRAAAATGPYTKLNSVPHPSATFTDSTVEGGMTYFYMATAVNKHGRESKYSNQVRVTVPNS
jgi:fibronectin type 3 domain-containing protein